MFRGNSKEQQLVLENNTEIEEGKCSPDTSTATKATATATGPTSVTTRQREAPPVFPARLHMLLNEAEKKGFGNVIRWLPDGKGFQVFSREMMQEVVIPLYFGATKWKSFQRQMNLYGFRSMRDPVTKERKYLSSCLVKL